MNAALTGDDGRGREQLPTVDRVPTYEPEHFLYFLLNPYSSLRVFAKENEKVTFLSETDDKYFKNPSEIREFLLSPYLPISSKAIKKQSIHHLALAQCTDEVCRYFLLAIWGFQNHFKEKPHDIYLHNPMISCNKTELHYKHFCFYDVVSINSLHQRVTITRMQAHSIKNRTGGKYDGSWGHFSCSACWDLTVEEFEEFTTNNHSQAFPPINEEDIFPQLFSPLYAARQARQKAQLTTPRLIEYSTEQEIPQKSLEL